jgi:hypothetical protein
MILVGFFADRGEPLVHGEGEGIAGLRAVENDPPDAAIAFKDEVFRRRDLLVHLPSLSCFL